MNKIIAEHGVSLRTCPSSPLFDSVKCHLPCGTKVLVLDSQVYDLFGDHKYLKVKDYSGNEGYVLAEAVGE